eukprot:6197451-Pleurochrysis_carterae.AAC.1
MPVRDPLGGFKGLICIIMVPRPKHYHIDPRARPTVDYKLSSRAPFISNLTLTCTVSQFAIASHAYSRSARASLPKLLEIRSRWPPLPAERPFLEPPPRRAPAPAPAPALRPVIVIISTSSYFPARPGRSL